MSLKRYAGRATALVESSAGLPSLRGRVVRASALVAAGVGLIAAFAALGLARYEQSLAERGRLRDAAKLVATELLEPDSDVALEAQREADEFAAMGLRVAVFQEGRLIAGAPNAVLSQDCVASEGVRWCTLPSNGNQIVVGREDAGLPWGLLFTSTVLATVLAAIAGAIGSRAAANWALRSLSELNSQLDSAGKDLRRLSLRSPAGTAEVEVLRKTVNSLVEQLEGALERARVFASGTAHELRTPLAVLTAELELLQQGPSDPTDLARRAMRTTRRLNVLIETLLLLARGETELVHAENIALEDVATEATVARADAEQTRIDLDLADQGMVRGTAALLRAIVDNLLDNALKHGVGRVRLSIAKSADTVVLRVSDDGPGLDAQQLSELRKPFVRGTGQAAGHGLGLAIAAQAVELHGGTLFSESGGILVVTLPSWRP